ncbi:uncharacterized protein LY89DRAFT_547698, partial [Mollisia scopiformis]
MAPNSRPPLTSRIRASFDGKRTKSEVTSPTHTNGFITQDPESLRSAIDEAINSETFQKAIAANLAKLIKPSIKSALDTIQPVVEAVYSHELLLRKTNQSVEDILLRLDEKGVTASRRESLVEPLGPEPNDGVPTAPADEGDDGGGKTLTQETPRAVTTSSSDLAQHKKLLEDNHAKTTSSLAELSSNVEVSNGKIAEALQGISDVDTKLRWASDSIDSLKSSSEQSHTTMSVLQAQLDQLKEDIGQLMTAVGSDLGKNVQALSQHGGAQDTSLFDAHTTKLDAISTDIAALKAHSDTVEKIDAVSTELASLKTSVEAGIASNSEGFSGLGSQISTVLTTLEGHTGTLSEIKEKAPHPEILSALQQSNDSHAAHAIALGEIKERSGAAPTPIATDNGSSDSTAALQELKADLASLRENIEAGLTSNNENVTSVGAKVDNVLSTIEGHKASDPSADILAAVQQSNDSHASHTAALDELKSREIAPAAALDTSEIDARGQTHASTLDEIKLASTTHASALDELKSPGIPSMGAVDNTSFAALEIQIGSIINTLNVQTAAIKELRPTSSESTEIASPPEGSEGLGGIMTTVVETLEMHTMLLNEMKEDVSAEILTTLHDLSQMQVNQTNLLTEIREADLSDEVLTLLHATTSLASQDMHAAHATSLDEIKSRSIEPSAASPVDLSGLETQLNAISASLEEHKTMLSNITDASLLSNISHTAHTSILSDIKDASTASNESHSAHAAALSDIKDATSSWNEAHSANAFTLAEIKDATLASNENLSPIEGHLTSIISTLEGQSSSLAEIKEASSHEDILANISDLKSIISESHAEHGILVKDLHTETKDSHSHLAEAIGALALGGAAGAGTSVSMDDSSKEVLSEVQAMRVVLDGTKEKVESVAAQIDINHTTVTTSITTLSDELKAEIDATGTHVTDHVLSIDLNPLTQSVKTVESKLEGLESSVKQTGSFVVGLYEGVHLNDTGVGQLQE